MSYSDELVRAVWGKAQVVDGYDPRRIRQDQCGAWIKWSRYGKTDSSFGWVVDRLKESLGEIEGQMLDNLRPLQWKNAETKKDGLLSCPVRAKGDKNAVRRETPSSLGRMGLWEKQFSGK